MLYNLLAPFAEDFILFNLFRYLTFRSGGAVMTALIISFLIGPAMIRWLKKKQKELNEGEDVDYVEVMKFKISALKDLFGAMKEEFLQDDGYLEFFQQNRHWLVPYAAFCYLRDRNGTPDFNQWKVYGTYNKASIEKYVSPKAKHYDEISFTYFLQYHLHLQFYQSL